MVFSIFGALAALGIGNMVQANTMADVMGDTFSLNPWITAGNFVVVVGLVIIGSIRRIANVTGYLVPIMAVFYIIAASIIILINIH